MYGAAAQVAVHPFTRQPDGEETVIGRADTGVFLALPNEAVEILDWLQEGLTVGEAQQRYGERYGEIPDIEDLLELLQAKGFVRPRTAAAAIAPAAAGPASPAPAADPTARRIRYHFANIPVPLARALFGNAALAIAAAVVAVAAVAVAVDHSLIPHREALIFAQHRSVKTLALVLLGYATVFIHEMGHLIAARAVGVSSRLGISSRMWVLVAETDMTGLWSVPKRQRYLPMLAGALIDLVSASLLTIMLFAQHRGWIALPAVAVQLSMAMVFVYMMRIVWQCFFFVRTDFYFVIATFFGCKRLMQDTTQYVRAEWRRLVSSQPSEVRLPDIPASEQRVIRYYAWVWLLGRALALWVLFAVTLPVAGKYLWLSLASLRAGIAGSDTYTVFDALFILVFYLFPLGLGMSLWIQALVRRRRAPRGRQPQTIST